MVGIKSSRLGEFGTFSLLIPDLLRPVVVKPAGILSMAQMELYNI